MMIQKEIINKYHRSFLICLFLRFGVEQRSDSEDLRLIKLTVVVETLEGEFDDSLFGVPGTLVS